MLNFKEFVNMQELDYFSFLDLLLGWFDEYKMDVDTLAHRNRPKTFMNITKQEELTEEVYYDLISQGHISLNAKKRKEHTMQNIRFIDVGASDFDLIMIQELWNDKIGYVYRDDFAHTAVWKHVKTTFLAINENNEYVAYTYKKDHFPNDEEDLLDLEGHSYFAKGNMKKYFIAENVIINQKLDLSYFVDPQVGVLNPNRLVSEFLEFFDGFKLNSDLRFHIPNITDETVNFYDELVKTLLTGFIQLKPLGKMQSGPRLDESLESSQELSEVDDEVIRNLKYNTVVLFEEISEGIAGRIFHVLPDSWEDNLAFVRPFEAMRFFLYDDNSKKKNALIIKEKHNTWRYKAGFVSMDDLTSPASAYNRGLEILEHDGKKRQNVAFLNSFVFMTFEGEGREELMKLVSQLESNNSAFMGNYLFNVFNTMNRTKTEMRKQFDTINTAFDSKVWTSFLESLNPLEDTLIDYQEPRYEADRVDFVQKAAELIAHQEEILSEYLTDATIDLRTQEIGEILSLTLADEDKEKYRKVYKEECYSKKYILPIDLLSTYYYLLNLYINQELETVDNPADFDEVSVVEKANEMIWVLFKSSKKIIGIDINDINSSDPSITKWLETFTFLTAGRSPKLYFRNALEHDLLALVEVLEPEEIEGFVDRLVAIQLAFKDPENELSLKFHKPIHDFIKDIDTEVVLSQKTNRWETKPINVKYSSIKKSMSYAEYGFLSRMGRMYSMFDRVRYLQLPLNVADPVLYREEGIKRPLRQSVTLEKGLEDSSSFWYLPSDLESLYQKDVKEAENDGERFDLDRKNSLLIPFELKNPNLPNDIDYLLESVANNSDEEAKDPKIEIMKNESLKEFVNIRYQGELKSYQKTFIKSYIFYTITTGDPLLDIPFETFMENGVAFSTLVGNLSYYVTDQIKVKYFLASSEDIYMNKKFNISVSSEGLLEISDRFKDIFDGFEKQVKDGSINLDAGNDCKLELFTDTQDLVKSIILSDQSSKEKLGVANNIIENEGTLNLSEQLVYLNKVAKVIDSDGNCTGYKVIK